MDINNKLIYNKDPQIVGGHFLLHVRDFQNANYRILCQDHDQALRGVVNMCPNCYSTFLTSCLIMWTKIALAGSQKIRSFREQIQVGRQGTSEE